MKTDYLSELKRSQASLSNIINEVLCLECKEPLTPEEIAEATKAELKHPICNDCYADFISQKIEEHRHPDDHS